MATPTHASSAHTDIPVENSCVLFTPVPCPVPTSALQTDIQIQCLAWTRFFEFQGSSTFIFFVFGGFPEGLRK